MNLFLLPGIATMERLSSRTRAPRQSSSFLSCRIAGIVSGIAALPLVTLGGQRPFQDRAVRVVQQATAAVSDTTSRATSASGIAVVSRVVCVVGQTCPSGAPDGAVLRSDGSVVIAYASGRIVVVSKTGVTSMVSQDSLSPAVGPSTRSSIPAGLSRVVGTVDTANGVILNASRLLVFGRSHRDRPVTVAIDWPRFTQEGSIGGLSVAALVVPPGRSVTDSVSASVEVLSAAESSWAVHAQFLTRPRSVIGSRFATFPGLFQTTEKWAVDARGNIWVGDPSKPRVARYDARTGKVTSVAWDGPLVPVTQHEVDSLRARLYRSEKGLPAGSVMVLAMHVHTDSLLRNLPPAHPAIVAVVAASDTTLWVQKTHVPGDEYEEWIRVSGGGHILETVRIPSSARFLDARHDTILAATEVGHRTSIAIYRLPPG